MRVLWDFETEPAVQTDEAEAGRAAEQAEWAAAAAALEADSTGWPGCHSEK